MPLLKMLTSLCGPEYSLSPGDSREFPEAEASRLILAGFAEATDGSTPVDPDQAARDAEAAEAQAKADAEAAAAAQAQAEADAAAAAAAPATPAPAPAPAAKAKPAAPKKAAVAKKAQG